MRADLTAWKKSTTPSVFRRSSWEWIQAKVPLRPTPLLVGGGEGGAHSGPAATGSTTHSLAHDSDGSVARVHLCLSDHVQHLHQRASGVRPAMHWPLSVVELGHHKAIARVGLEGRREGGRMEGGGREEVEAVEGKTVCVTERGPTFWS